MIFDFIFLILYFIEAWGANANMWGMKLEVSPCNERTDLIKHLTDRFSHFEKEKYILEAVNK